MLASLNVDISFARNHHLCIKEHYGKVKFCCANSFGNLKITFSDDKNVSYDSFWMRKLRTER